jgi:hypothetical protein
LDDAVGSNGRGIDMLRRELAMSEAMSAKGLLSEVEVLHLRRQINDLSLQSEDRLNRFRQDASSELAKLQTDLTQLEEQQAGRQDVLSRTIIKSPVHGLVKNIRINTLGGVIGPGVAHHGDRADRQAHADRGAREAGRHRLPEGGPDGQDQARGLRLHGLRRPRRRDRVDLAPTPSATPTASPAAAPTRRTTA